MYTSADGNLPKFDQKSADGKGRNRHFSYTTARGILGGPCLPPRALHEGTTTYLPIVLEVGNMPITASAIMNVPNA